MASELAAGISCEIISCDTLVGEGVSFLLAVAYIEKAELSLQAEHLCLEVGSPCCPQKHAIFLVFGCVCFGITGDTALYLCPPKSFLNQRAWGIKRVFAVTGPQSLEACPLPLTLTTLES